jgi:hypothetical protein
MCNINISRIVQDVNFNLILDTNGKDRKLFTKFPALECVCVYIYIYIYICIQSVF